MNYAHLEYLKQQMEKPNDFNAVTELLGKELLISQDAIHPTAGWQQPLETRHLRLKARRR